MLYPQSIVPFAGSDSCTDLKGLQILQLGLDLVDEMITDLPNGAGTEQHSEGRIALESTFYSLHLGLPREKSGEAGKRVFWAKLCTLFALLELPSCFL